ncbi:MAG: hypothetical protein JWM40_65 [Frankiales bacterium]|nr:hypothetical protein [Frankiales bacterium]
MSRTSTALRRLSVPVLVTSVIMTGISFAGFAGVANAAVPNGTLVLTADNTGTAAPAPDPYATIQDDPYGSGDDTITVDATYTPGTAAASSTPGNANAQVVTFTVSGHATFVATGTNTDTCTIAAGGGNCGTAPVVQDPISEAPVVTASIVTNATNPGNDPTVPTVQTTLHFASLHFNNCAQTGANTTNNPPTAPDNFCFTQQTAGAAVTQTVTYLQDGAPKANVSIEIDANDGDATFAATQPAGSAFFSTDQVNCNTNAQGQCSFTYTDATAQTGGTPGAATPVASEETFYAFTVANTTPYPNSEADEVVDFITSATPARIEQISRTTVRPSGFGTRKPGVAQEVQYRLFSTCTTIAGDATCEGTPLANRSVALSVNHGFFTRNCSVSGVGGSASYANCTFSPVPTAGSPVGNLASLGTTTTVTTDADGYFYATLGIARDAGFDDDGEVLATVTGVATGSAATLTANNPGTGSAGQNCTTSPGNGGCTTFIEWNTTNNPLNGGTITFVPIDGGVLTGDPNFVPNQNLRTYVVHATDQFGNLTDANGNIQITWTGAGYAYDCGYTGPATCPRGTDTGSFYVDGSFTNADEQDRIVSSADEVLADATPAENGLQTVTAAWDAPRTVFTTYSPAVGATPAVATYTSDTVAKTAVVKFEFYDQAAQPVVTFSTTPSNTVAAGTVVTVSATVKDQHGFPIVGYPVDFFVNGTNVASCNPIHNPAPVPTNSAGKAGFSFGCNNPGTAAVTIVVADGSGNEVARGVQNVTFTNGTPPPSSTDPSFSLNVGTIQIGQCAVLTVNGTSGHTITIFVKGASAAGFTALNSMQPTQHMRVCPGTNSTYKVSSDLGTSPAQTLLVKAIETLVVSRHGQSATFAGHVIPGVVGRRVQVFFYVDGGHVQSAGVGTVKPGGNFSFTSAVNHPGKVVHAFAQTFADSFNTSGRSRVISTQF